MENKVFKVVLLQALPASGKSEVRNFMANIEPERLKKEFHIGENLQLDDFPYVHMMRRIDNELKPWASPDSSTRARSPSLTEETGARSAPCSTRTITICSTATSSRPIPRAAAF